MTNLEKLQEFDTIQTADCVVQCDPMIICTTYQLNEEKKKRVGTIYFFEIEDGVDKPDARLNEVSKYRLECSGVFDLKVSTDNKSFVVATSDGTLDMYECKEQVNLKNSVSFFEDSSMCLYVDYFCEDKIAVSHSNGNISSVDMEKSVTDSWKAHEFEAWTVCHDSKNENILLSGGDDMLLKLWDKRTHYKPIKIFREHEAGVCEIVMMKDEGLFSTGSYDEKIRIFDLRKSKVIEEVECGGGVWRLRWNKNNPDLLAAACMRSGFQIYKFGGGEKARKIVTYDKGEELAYGIDWVGSSEGKEFWMCSCSFYDHEMQFWKFSLEE